MNGVSGADKNLYAVLLDRPLTNKLVDKTLVATTYRTQSLSRVIRLYRTLRHYLSSI